MSIATEISRLQTAKANIKTAIENKGVTVPSSTTLDGYPTLINQISGGGGSSDPLQMGVLRPDAELIQTYSYDKHLVADEEISVPAYSTTAQTLKASSSLTPTLSLDLANYNYFVLIRMLTIPEYNITSVAKGRDEWLASSCLYEIADLEENTVHTLIDPTKYVTGRSSTVLGAGAFHRLCYWTTTTTAAVYTGAAYGCYQTVTAPSLSSTTLTLRTPALMMRGSTTYYTQTYMEATTDVRYQWKIEVYRVPRTNELNGAWGTMSQWLHIMDNAYSNSQTLT